MMDDKAISRALEAGTQAQARLDKLQAMCDELLLALKAHTQRDAQITALVEAATEARWYIKARRGDNGHIYEQLVNALAPFEQE